MTNDIKQMPIATLIRKLLTRNDVKEIVRRLSKSPAMKLPNDFLVVHSFIDDQFIATNMDGEDLLVVGQLEIGQRIRLTDDCPSCVIYYPHAEHVEILEAK